MIPTTADLLNLTTWADLYSALKYCAALGGGLWAVFNLVRWVKDIREIDLAGLKTSALELKSATVVQTAVIERGFDGLRQDFRTFYTSPDPMMVPVRARKRQSVANRTAAKKRASAVAKKSRKSNKKTTDKP